MVMPRKIDQVFLLEWFETICLHWPQAYQPALLTCRSHPQGMLMLEAAYFLEQLNIDQHAQYACLCHHLQMPLSEITQATVRHLVERLYLLDDLGKLSELQQKSQETLRKMLLAMAQDIRVVVVFLADQVVKMRHLSLHSSQLQQQMAQNTLNVYAPLANRLGLGRLKWELEDLSLRYLDPDSYRQIANALDERRSDREQYIIDTTQCIITLLQAHHIEAEVSGRVKHLYSIWRKMQKKGRHFDELFDVRAVRIIVESIADCYTVLGLIHAQWTPIPKEFDDYIANPKPNGYQSLHTAVLGSGHKTLEVQIRTREMHDYAELGVAAHWRYKEGNTASNQQEALNWLRQLIEEQHHNPQQDSDDQEAPLEAFQTDVFSQHVYVVTPKGQAIELLQGSTPLDFAYHIHTNLGHRCRGAKVNKKIVPLTQVLKNGDQVEILTSKEAQPSRDWLSPHLGYLKSSRSRAKVRAWFKAQDQEKNLAAGKQMLERELNRLHLHCNSAELNSVAQRFNVNHLNDLYTLLGAGEITLNQVVGRLPMPEKEVNALPMVRTSKTKINQQNIVHVHGMNSVMTVIAQCCQPAPPEVIGGFVTANRGVSIHRSDCSNFLHMIELEPMRRIEVEWGNDPEMRVIVEIMIRAYERSDLLREITAVIANERLKALQMKMHSNHHNEVVITCEVEINHINQLSRLLDRLVNLPNVIEARRYLK